MSNKCNIDVIKQNV